MNTSQVRLGANLTPSCDVLLAKQVSTTTVWANFPYFHINHGKSQVFWGKLQNSRQFPAYLGPLQNPRHFPAYPDFQEKWEPCIY